MWLASPTTPIRTWSAPTVRMVCWNSGSLEVLNLNWDWTFSHSSCSPHSGHCFVIFPFLSLGESFQVTVNMLMISVPHHTIYSFSRIFQMSNCVNHWRHIAENWKLLAVWGLECLHRRALICFLGGFFWFFEVCPPKKWFKVWFTQPYHFLYDFVRICVMLSGRCDFGKKLFKLKTRQSYFKFINCPFCTSKRVPPWSSRFSEERGGKCS